MYRRTIVTALTIALVLGAAWVGQAIAQEQRGDRPQRDPEQMRQRMEQFRQEASTRMRESLGMNEDEWKAIQPKIEKVSTLSRQSRGGMFGGMRRGRGGAPDAAPRPTDQPQSDVEKKTTELQTLLPNKEASPDQIKAALKGLREARAKAADELTAARKELREALTLRQEAQLVLMGLLD